MIYGPRRSGRVSAGLNPQAQALFFIERCVKHAGYMARAAA